MAWYDLTKIKAAIGGTAAVIATIVFSNDPEALQKRSCFVTQDILWSCDAIRPAADPLALNGPDPQYTFTPGPSASASAPAAVVPAPPAVPAVDDRPRIELDGTTSVERRGSQSTVSVLVRAKITNTGKEPILVSWDNIRDTGRVTVPAGGELEPTHSSVRKPSGVVNCRFGANPCWERYRAEFTQIFPGESITGAITYAKAYPNSDIEAILAAPTYAFAAQLIHGAASAAMPKVMTISLENQTLKQGGQ